MEHQRVCWYRDKDMEMKRRIRIYIGNYVVI